MRVCIAQTKAVAGNIKAYTDNHLILIEEAAKLKVELIVFPELSITGYEPTIAKDLNLGSDAALFDVFQNVSDQYSMHIGIGVPLKVDNGVTISMIVFQPFKNRLVYSKQILHPDEFSYFLASYEQPYLEINDLRIGLGICYETLHRSHFVKAAKIKADLFVASVSKPERGLNKALMHFPDMAVEFKMPIMMVNSIGHADNFLSTGKSSVWNSEGKLLGSLNTSDQGLLIYDTEASDIVIKKIKNGGH